MQQPNKDSSKVPFFTKDKFMQFMIGAGFFAFTLIEIYLSTIPKIGLIVSILFWPLIALIIAFCFTMIFKYSYPMNISRNYSEQFIGKSTSSQI